MAPTVVQSLLLKKKMILTLVSGKEDFFEDYHNRGERLGSTLSTARTKGDLEPRSRVGGEWAENL